MYLENTEEVNNVYVVFKGTAKMAKDMRGGGGLWVVSIDGPLNNLHFRWFFTFLKRPRPLNSKNVLERLNNSACHLIESRDMRYKNAWQSGWLFVCFFFKTGCNIFRLRTIFMGFFFECSWIFDRGGGRHCTLFVLRIFWDIFCTYKMTRCERKPASTGRWWQEGGGGGRKKIMKEKKKKPKT